MQWPPTGLPSQDVDLPGEVDKPNVHLPESCGSRTSPDSCAWSPHWLAVVPIRVFLIGISHPQQRLVKSRSADQL
jgi:hypothetical protein